MAYLFLDDIRNVEQVFDYTYDQRYLMKWDIVRNYDDFIKYIEENEMPEIISFDHDLGFDLFLENDYDDYNPDEEKNGYDCTKWLLKYCIDNKIEPPSIILIHSANGSGSLNIKSMFDTYNKFYKKSIEVINYHI